MLEGSQGVYPLYWMLSCIKVYRMLQWSSRVLFLIYKWCGIGLVYRLVCSWTTLVLSSGPARPRSGSDLGPFAVCRSTSFPPFLVNLSLSNNKGKKMPKKWQPWYTVNPQIVIPLESQTLLIWNIVQEVFYKKSELINEWMKESQSSRVLNWSC